MKFLLKFFEKYVKIYSEDEKRKVIDMMNKYEIRIKNCIGSTIFDEKVYGYDGTEALIRALKENLISLDEGDTVEIFLDID